MRILTLLTLIAAAYFVARGDQHAGCASVIAADGRVWNNVRMDWTIAGDGCLQSCGIFALFFQIFLFAIGWFAIHIPSMRMVSEDGSWPEKYNRLRDKTEKITINVGFVDLGHIDLLVHEGFYSNRTDFIRTAIRNQLAAHADAVKQSIVRHTLELGLRRYSREELEAVKAAGGKLHIQVVGLATIAEDVTPELALATIESITVLGALHASKAVKAALSDRIG
jgi:Arc/MetJ-type ribon-helix-helix transcriptional regulator